MTVSTGSVENHAVQRPASTTPMTGAPAATLINADLISALLDAFLSREPDRAALPMPTTTDRTLSGRGRASTFADETEAKAKNVALENFTD